MTTQTTKPAEQQPQPAGTTALAKKPAEATMADFLRSDVVAAKLAEVATEHMKPKDLVRYALVAISRNPDLAHCTQASVLRALMDAAALGIEPGGFMGRGYLIPRNNKRLGKKECHLDPGWRGLCDAAKRSGVVKTISAHAVYENDFFEVEFGTEEKLTHRPAKTNKGKVIGAYAVAFFADGTKQFESLDATDLAKIRSVSEAASGPWASWEEEMARKSAVRRLCKYLPYSSMLERALQAATEADGVSFAREVPEALKAGDVVALEQELLGGDDAKGAEGETVEIVDQATGEITRETRK